MTDQRIDSSGYDQIISLDHNKTQTEVVKFRIRSNARRADIERRSQMSQSADIGHQVIISQLYDDFQVLYPNVFAKVSKGLMFDESIARARQSAARELTSQWGVSPSELDHLAKDHAVKMRQDNDFCKNVHAWFYHNLCYGDVGEPFPQFVRSTDQKTTINFPSTMMLEEFAEEQWDAARASLFLADGTTCKGNSNDLEGLRQQVSNIRDQGMAWGQEILMSGVAFIRAVKTLADQRARTDEEKTQMLAAFDRLIEKNFVLHANSVDLRNQMKIYCQSIHDGRAPHGPQGYRPFDGTLPAAPSSSPAAPRL